MVAPKRRPPGPQIRYANNPALLWPWDSHNNQISVAALCSQYGNNDELHLHIDILNAKPSGRLGCAYYSPLTRMLCVLEDTEETLYFDLMTMRKS